MRFQPFDPEVDTSRTRRRLPHWFQEGRTYFVTFRLADSLPRQKREQLKIERDAWLAAHGMTSPDQVDRLPPSDQSAYRLWFSERTEALLNAGYGLCVLGRTECGRIVEQALRFFEEERYHLDEYVIMTNHVHVLLCPIPPFSLSRILHSWKRHSAREINALLRKTGTSLWLDESFDHIVRRYEQLDHYRKYIRNNPENAKSRRGTYRLGRGRTKL